MINIYIDSNVFVASEIKEEIYHSESREFMDFVLKNRKNELVFFTSVFTFLELSSAMIRRTSNEDKAYSLLYKDKKFLEIIYTSITTHEKKNNIFYKFSRFFSRGIN